MEDSYLTLEQLKSYSMDNLYLLLEMKPQTQITHTLSERNICLLYENTEYDSLSRYSPILYLLNKEENIHPKYMGSYTIQAIFLSRFNLKEVAGHFKHCLTALLPDKTKSIFRFYSPKILELIVNSERFGELNRNKMLSPFSNVFVNVGSNFKKVYSSNNTKLMSLEKEWIRVSQPFFDEIEESYYQNLLHQIALDIYFTDPYKIMFFPKEKVVEAIDYSFKMLPKTESLMVKKKFIIFRFKYASHYFLLPEFILAKEQYSLEYALQKLSFHKKWQRLCQEQFDDVDWVNKITNLSEEHI